jgi:DNA-binding MarR family transcriptional regulator
VDKRGACRRSRQCELQAAQLLSLPLYSGHDISPLVEPPALDARGSDCIGETLDQAADLTARYLADRAGLSVSAGYVLNRVSRGGPARLTALASKEGVSQPSMTQLIQRLERQGLVTRLADPDDGRVALVAITEAGQALLDQGTRIRRERLTALLATLSSEEEFALWLSAQVALPILHRLVKNADSLAEYGGGHTGHRVLAPDRADARSGDLRMPVSTREAQPTNAVGDRHVTDRLAKGG